MANFKWQISNVSRSIFHLPFAICHLPSEIPLPSFAFGLLSFAFLSLAACGYKAPAVPADNRIASAPLPPVQPYRLKNGDSIGVKFYQNDTLNEDVVIRPDGMISLQLIGDVKAAGLTPDELVDEIRQHYASELSNPRISVIVRGLGTYRIYVGGEVGAQGTLDLSGNVTLYQAIQQAGGLLLSAHRKQIVLIRGVHEGHPVGHTVDIRPIQSGERPEEDVLLEPYDIVFVPKSKIQHVNDFVQQYIRDALPINPQAFIFRAGF
jgi:protein involved in polysaccharide export with SLBB domain